MTTLFGDFAALLRHVRRRANRTQADAAQHIGKTPRAVSGYESGETMPSLDVFDRLLVFYGIADLAQLQAEIDALRGGATSSRRITEDDVRRAFPGRASDYYREMADLYARLERLEGKGPLDHKE